jgi:hypothetical protein
MMGLNFPSGPTTGGVATGISFSVAVTYLQSVVFFANDRLYTIEWSVSGPDLVTLDVHNIKSAGKRSFQLVIESDGSKIKLPAYLFSRSSSERIMNLAGAV